MTEKIQHLFRNNDFNTKPGVVGCALSHINLWTRLLEDTSTDYYFILEDDVQFADNFMWKLYCAMQSITFNWDMLFTGHLVCYENITDHRDRNVLPKWEKMSDYIIPKRTSWVGTSSYMISKSGAKKLLDDIERTGVMHGIDYYIQLRFDKLLRAYGLRPMLNFSNYYSPLCVDKIDSDIQ